jgi:hypothetical protein
MKFYIEKALHAFTVLYTLLILPGYDHFISYILIDLSLIVQYGVGDIGKNIFEKRMIFFIPQLFGDGSG